MPRLEAGQIRGTRIPCEVSGDLPLESPQRPLQRLSGTSEEVLEVYSPSILKLVSRLVSPLRILGITMCTWLVVRVNIA